MTVAVCLRCGGFKHGAFNRCRNCGYSPDDDESLTKHLLSTDHFHSREALQDLADQVKAGKAIDFDPKKLKSAWVSKADLDAHARRMGRRFNLVWGAALVLMIAGICMCLLAR